MKTRRAVTWALALVTAAATSTTAARAGATTCSVASIVGVAFGGYDPLDPSPLDSTGSITIDCSGAGASDPVAVELSRGPGNVRALTNGLSLLHFDLFLDAARAVVWGDGADGTTRWLGYGLTGSTTVIVYGRAAARQNVTVGAYAGTVTATILY